MMRLCNSFNLRKLLKNKQILRFREDGRFRILCVSDIHGGKDYDADFTVAGLRKLLDATRPDLVLLLGDVAGPGVIHIENADQLRDMLDGLAEPLESAGIPWAHVFGNHDDNFGLSNRDAMKVYDTYPHCLSKTGPDDVAGAGNYVLPLYAPEGKKILFNIFALDTRSGDMVYDPPLSDARKAENEALLARWEHLPAPDGPAVEENFLRGSGGPDITAVRWYYETSQKIEAKNGAPVPAMMVMHVPPLEVAGVDVDEESAARMENLDLPFRIMGAFKEKIAAEGLSSATVGAALERGDVRTMCFGHVHRNNFAGTYKGIFMALDGFLSAHACHDPDFMGGRVFDLSADETVSTSVNVAVSSKVVLLKDC